MKHNQRHGNKVSENKVLYCEALRCETIKNNKKSCFPLCQTNKPTIILNQISKNWTSIQGASGYSTAPTAARTISCKAWNSPVAYPNIECNYGIKESKGNMFNPIFKENAQGQKHPGSCACIGSLKVNNDHKNPNDSHNYHDENHNEIKLYLGNSNSSTQWHSTLEQRTPKNQSDRLYGYGVLLTNVQCHRYLYPYHDIENTGTSTESTPETREYQIIQYTSMAMPTFDMYVS